MMPIEELRQALLTERRRLFERVARVEEDLRWLDTNVELEMEEEAQEATIARLLARLDDRGVAEIGAIDRALARMANGEYGCCETCGAIIPLDRLRALPAATTCTACAAGAERTTP
jgi:RNA polymerase-binding protein DksA